MNIDKNKIQSAALKPKGIKRSSKSRFDLKFKEN